MTPQVLEFVSFVRGFQFRALTDTAHISTAMSDKDAALEEMVDAIYALRTCEEIVDHVRKQIEKVLDNMQKTVVLRWISLGAGEPIRTDFCTGSPDVSQAMSIPSKDSEEYRALMRHFNVPLDAPVKLHYPSLSLYITAQQSSGGPLPPGVNPDKLTTAFYVTTRKRRDIPSAGLPSFG